MTVKITSLEMENVKRVRAVRLEPAADGLTLIGGDNCQGKTSILDAICYALGGERYRPTNLQREGGSADARIELVLSNGLKVERAGKHAALKVTDPSGAKAGQRLLDTFVEELALNLPKFLAMPGREKAQVLLNILGIGDRLEALDKVEKAAYDERRTQGRIADQKEKYAAEMPEWHDVPAQPVTPAQLVAESQAIMQRNAERANARRALATATENLERKRKRVAELEEMLVTARKEEDEAARALNLTDLVVDADESTAEIEAKLAELEEINAKVRANLDKRKAIEDAETARSEYDRLTAVVDAARAERLALLDGAAMPLPGLSIENSELTYAGKAWDCMSSAEQIRAGAAIVRRLQPECGFILLDGLECFDREQLTELGAWLEAEHLQAIATRVSRGEECSIIIEDGLVVAGQNDASTTAKTAALADW